jgi:hypothetical protein
MSEGAMLSAINVALSRFFSCINDLPYAVQSVLFIITMSLVVGVGWYVGALSKENPGNHIPGAWRQ